MIKIFLVYHKPFEIFKTEVLEPIQSGFDDAEFDLGVLRDNTGDNISCKNKNYGELTCWYWVWKNYLRRHPELEYVGFGHYRRVLAFPDLHQKRCAKKFYSSQFKKILKNYQQSILKNEVEKYDIILYQKTIGRLAVENDYKSAHPSKDWDLMKSIVISRYPIYKKIVEDFSVGHDVHLILNFVMKRALFMDFMEWIFPLLFEVENQSDWSKYEDYYAIRTPAFLAEMFFNVWLRIKIAENPGLKIKENKLYFILSDLPLRFRILRKLLFLLPKKKRDKIRAEIERM